MPKIVEINDAVPYGFDGYRVKTETQEILLLIENCPSCCESWGYVTSEDDLQSFVGADLRDFYLTTTGLETIRPKLPDLDCGDVMFVTFNTDKGAFQLAVYNSHNGYYGHRATLRVNGEVREDEYL